METISINPFINGGIFITVSSGGNWGMFYVADYPVMISSAFRIA